MAHRQCPLCGADDHACGPSGLQPAVTITPRIRTVAEVAELKEYTFTNEDGRQVTLRLSDDDAKKRGLTGTKKTAPDNKSRTPENK